MKKYTIFVLLLNLVGCQMTSEDYFNERVVRHEKLLRHHFRGRKTGYDVASLINMTSDIANQLRGRGRFGDANRFDSYRDVLIYGANTIDESINDMRKLVIDGVPNEHCSLLSKLKKLFRPCCCE